MTFLGRLHLIVLAFLLSVFFPASASAVPTELVVRILAKDAKFIGTEVGGIKVTVSDSDTGAVLAQGMANGGPGSTQFIMKHTHLRRDALSDADTAKFSAMLDFDQPRRITVTASGPNTVKAAATSVSSTAWVLPGKPVAGKDGWVLELPGFAVYVVDPPVTVTHSADSKIHVHANITMMCGCPITPGGTWDANKYEFAAQLMRGGKAVRSVPLVYGGKPNQFVGDLDVAEVGIYEVIVTAYDPADGNAGVDRFPVEVR